MSGSRVVKGEPTATDAGREFYRQPAGTQVKVYKRGADGWQLRETLTAKSGRMTA